MRILSFFLLTYFTLTPTIQASSIDFEPECVVIQRGNESFLIQKSQFKLTPQEPENPQKIKFSCQVQDMPYLCDFSVSDLTLQTPTINTDSFEAYDPHLMSATAFVEDLKKRGFIAAKQLSLRDSYNPECLITFIYKRPLEFHDFKWEHNKDRNRSIAFVLFGFQGEEATQMFTLYQIDHRPEILESFPFLHLSCGILQNAKRIRWYGESDSTWLCHNPAFFPVIYDTTAHETRGEQDMVLLDMGSYENGYYEIKSTRPLKHPYIYANGQGQLFQTLLVEHDVTYGDLDSLQDGKKIFTPKPQGHQIMRILQETNQAVNFSGIIFSDTFRQGFYIPQGTTPTLKIWEELNNPSNRIIGTFNPSLKASPIHEPSKNEHKLKILDLKDTWDLSSCEEIIQTLRVNAPTLQSINLLGAYLSNRETVEVAKVLATLPHLKEVSLEMPYCPSAFVEIVDLAHQDLSSIRSLSDLAYVVGKGIAYSVASPFIIVGSAKMDYENDMGEQFHAVYENLCQIKGLQNLTLKVWGWRTKPDDIAKMIINYRASQKLSPLQLTILQ